MFRTPCFVFAITFCMVFRVLSRPSGAAFPSKKRGCGKRPAAPSKTKGPRARWPAVLLSTHSA